MNFFQANRFLGLNLVLLSLVLSGCARNELVGVPPLDVYSSTETIEDLALIYKAALGAEYYDCFEVSDSEHTVLLRESSEYCAKYSFDALPSVVEEWEYDDASDDYSVCLMHVYFSTLKPSFKVGYKRAGSCYKVGTTLKVLDGSHPALSYLETSGFNRDWIDKYNDYSSASKTASQQLGSAQDESNLIANTILQLRSEGLGLGDQASSLLNKFGEPVRKIKKPDFSIWIYESEQTFIFNQHDQLKRIAFCEGCSEKFTRGTQRYKQKGMTDSAVIDMLFDN